MKQPSFRSLSLTILDGTYADPEQSQKDILLSKQSPEAAETCHSRDIMRELLARRVVVATAARLLASFAGPASARLIGINHSATPWYEV